VPRIRYDSLPSLSFYFFASISFLSYADGANAAETQFPRTRWIVVTCGAARSLFVSWFGFAPFPRISVVSFPVPERKQPRFAGKQNGLGRLSDL
jgi:hypothetical protein